jgi:pimeloyl-ACP methyl ester carboxylesterase
MPYATNEGLRLHYRNEGAGPPLLIQHGFTDSAETWYELGYVDALKRDYRLILLDARGHGNSDKPHDSNAYSWAIMAGDVVAVLDAEGLPSAHFLGYSMGAVIGFALAKYAPERVTSLMLGGSAPYQGDRASQEARVERLRQLGPLSGWGQPVSASIEARALANDTDALIAAAQGVNKSWGIDDVPPTMHMPCLLFVGEDDPSLVAVKACSAEMPNATLVTFPGLNHAATFLRPELVLAEVRRFLEAVALPTTVG